MLKPVMVASKRLALHKPGAKLTRWVEVWIIKAFFDYGSLAQLQTAYRERP